MKPYFCFALLAFYAPRIFAQGYFPEEAPSKMTPMPGFKAELIASEPMVRQPVAMEFDDRGRLWVVQYMQYPNPEGLKRVKVDRYSRTAYDRVPEPPPHGPRGNDTITILEDTNGDGRMDASKDFVQGLNLCSGIAFGYRGVFVIQVPYLLFYPDKDGDDKPDGDPEVLLTGFGMEDAHSVANSLTWGPDGWLYGNQGSTVTANINGIEFQQGVWRYHPVTEKFELFCEGGGNMWGLDFDWEGNLFSSTNFGPYIALHGVQGAYYWKQFGKHGALHNSYTYGYFEHMTHHNPAGGHVAVGGTIYEAGAYPAEFRGKYIFANLLSHDAYVAELKPTGSTFETNITGQFLNSNDTWFAPSDLTLGPDGAIYIADWCDKRTAHPDPDAEWDRSNGRIYRVVTDSMTPVRSFDIRKMSTHELTALLNHPNKWFVRRALVEIAGRNDKRANGLLLQRVEKADDPRLALNSLFALHGSEEVDESLAIRLLEHRFAPVRKWAVRFLGEYPSITQAAAASLASISASESDVWVQSQLASTAKRLPAEQGLPIVWNLAKNNDVAADPHLPLLMWWAVEHHAINSRQSIIDTVEAWPDKDAVWVKDTLLPNLIRRFASEGSAECDALCVRLIAAGDSWHITEKILTALNAGLVDRQRPATGEALGSLFAGYAQQSSDTNTALPSITPPSDELRNAVFARWKEAVDDPVLLRLAARLDNDDAYARAKTLAANSNDTEKQQIGIALLDEFGKADAAGVLLNIVSSKQSDATKQAALNALRHIPDDSVAVNLVKQYPSFDNAIKEKVRGVLVTRAAWSRVLAGAIAKGAIQADEVPLEQVRLMANHEDVDLRAQIEKIWGAVRAGTPEEKLAEVRRLNNELNAGKGDPVKGKVVFELNCAKCHQFFGEGFKVGPDLTQANRMDREYMLVSLVDPNLTIRKEYTQFVVETNDLGIFNGLIAERTPGSVTLINANEAKTTIASNDIADLREAGPSLMPENLITPISGDDLRNLFAYLQSPAPLPKP